MSQIRVPQDSTASSSTLGSRLADVMTRYYALNFIRKPEFMGFNGYNDGIKRTEFNPLAWPSDGQADENHRACSGVESAARR